jgi:thiosulfate dehydrogenase [quinone] large subunit
MKDILGLLLVEQWLALLRIAVGLWWLESVRHKPLRKFVASGMVEWTLALADNSPLPAYGKLIRRIVAPNRSWFPYFSLVGEAAVGIGLTLGFLTPISALVGLLLNFNYLALAGARPRDLTVNRCYQSEQGQNLMMIASTVVILATGAWSTWSLDRLLGLF